MRTLTFWILLAIVAAGSAIIVAQQQRYTARPGELTDAHAWIENRGRTQAIPVDLQLVNLDSPLRTQVTGDVSIRAADTLPVRPVRTAWEYRSFRFETGSDPANQLGELGIQGWEAIGIVSVPGQPQSVVLLKRSR